MVEPKKNEEERKQYAKDYADTKLRDIIEKLLDQKRIAQTEFDYIASFISGAKSKDAEEQAAFKQFHSFIVSEPICNVFLDNIKGLGDALKAQLIAAIEYCEKSEHIASLWKYMGMDIPKSREERAKEKDKKLCKVCGEERKHEKHKDKEDLDANPGLIEQGYHVFKSGYTHDPENSALLFKIADSFIKQQNAYVKHFYEPEKKRQNDMLNNAKCKVCGGVWNDKKHKGRKELEDSSKLTGQGFHSFQPDGPNAPVDGHCLCPERPKHAEMRARRYMMKMFLSHYWTIARVILMTAIPEAEISTRIKNVPVKVTAKNLPFSGPYSVEGQKCKGMGHAYINPFDFLKVLVEDKNTPTPKKNGKNGNGDTEEE
jgi:hypothetical protein